MYGSLEDGLEHIRVEMNSGLNVRSPHYLLSGVFLILTGSIKCSTYTIEIAQRIRGCEEDIHSSTSKKRRVTIAAKFTWQTGQISANHLRLGDPPFVIPRDRSH